MNRGTALRRARPGGSHDCEATEAQTEERLSAGPVPNGVDLSRARQKSTGIDLARKSLLAAYVFSFCSTLNALLARRLQMILPERGKSARAAQRDNHRKRRSFLQVEVKVHELKERDELQLSDLFSDETIHEVCKEVGYTFRDRAFTPAITLGLFVSQVLHRDEPCTSVVARINRYRKDRGLKAVSTDASAYCKARARLPVALAKRLIEMMRGRGRHRTPLEWQWHRRNVYLVDGLVVTAPDTEENQQVYAQPSSQAEGLGFPQVRMVITTSLATGCTLHYNTGPVEGKKTGEVSLFREKHGTFSANDIVVADSNFESFTDAALLRTRGVDLVCCINGTREDPFTDPCLAIDDQTVILPKPKFCTQRFTRELWQSLPESLEVRIIRYRTSGRQSEITLVTTLTDRQEYPAEDIAGLYGFRWDVELDIRALKTAMGMDRLRCRRPENLDREIAVHVLAYNLVRWLMCDTAKVFDVHPRQISFSIARDAWLAFADELETVNDLAWIIASAGSRFVRNRPGRTEPRAIKRRQSKYEKLKEPRPSRRRKAAAPQPDVP